MGCIQLFRERLSKKSVNVHATIPKCSVGHNKYFCSFTYRTDDAAILQISEMIPGNVDERVSRI